MLTKRIRTVSAKQKAQKKMSKATAIERIQNIRIDVEWRTHGRIPRKVVRKWLNDIQRE